MYQKFFGFKERPFQLVPNPAYLFLSKSHEEALAHLSYAVSQGDGFVEITGEVGTGKTTLCRVFLGGLGENTEAAYIFNPLLNAVQLLKAVNDEFGIDSRANTEKELIDTLNTFLMEKKRQGKQVIVLIDEAQKLGEDVLEQLRLLSNLETDTSKLLQIILVGQPELREMLDSQELRQLGQRITLSCYLTPLDFRETRAYIQHRIQIASQRPGVKFTRGAFWAIYRYSGGIPRLINIASDRALLTAYGLHRRKITGAIARSAIRELASRGDIRRYRLFDPKTAIVFFLVTGIGLSALLYAGGGFRLPPFGKPASSGEMPPPAPVQPTPSRTPSPPAETSDLLARSDEGPGPVFSESEHSEPEKTVPSPILEPDTSSRLTTGKTPTPETAPLSPSPEGPVSAESPEEETAPILAKTDTPSEDTPFSRSSSAEEGETISDTGPEENRLSPLSSLETRSPEPSPLEVPPGPQNLADLMQELEGTPSRRSAIESVMNLWQPDVVIKEYLKDIESADDFFRLAARQNAFSILRVEADLDLIRKLDLPAVLQLNPQDTGGPVFLPITGYKNGNLVFEGTGGSAVSVPPSDLEPYWNGIAYIPWKNYYGLTGIIPRNAPKDSIVSLKMLLRDIGFRELDITPVYDGKTLQAVEYIQKKHNVTVDGSVGPVTKIILYNEMASLQVPRLASRDAADAGEGEVR
jgi:general secretion pathway protein A